MTRCARTPRRVVRSLVPPHPIDATERNLQQVDVSGVDLDLELSRTLSNSFVRSNRRTIFSAIGFRSGKLFDSLSQLHSFNEVPDEYGHREASIRATARTRLPLKLGRVSKGTTIRQGRTMWWPLDTRIRATRAVNVNNSRSEFQDRSCR